MTALLASSRVWSRSTSRLLGHTAGSGTARAR
jgi:hypothetical protein